MPNDPVINNIASMAMQILHEAQGVRDISGAVPGDYETISPTAGASVQIANAETGRPFDSFVVTLPPQERSGEGSPSPENLRILPVYEKIEVQNGNNAPIEIILPDDFYGGTVDLINKRAACDILRVRVPPDASWRIAGNTSGESVVFIADDALPSYTGKTANNRYAQGENCNPGFYSSYSNLPAGRCALYADQASSRRMWYYPAAEGVTDVETFVQWLTDNPKYIYLRVLNPIESDIGNPIPYVIESNYTVSVSAGTAEITYSGIAPEETSESPGDVLASVPEEISRPEIPAIVEPETPAIVEPIAEEIKNQEDEEK